MKIKGMVVFALILTALSGVGGTAQAQTAPQADAAALDRLIHAAWQQKRIVPAKPVDDASCLRRICLDLSNLASKTEPSAYSRIGKRLRVKWF